MKTFQGARVQRPVTLAVLGLCFSGWVAAACPSWPTAERFAFNAPGSEVTDRQTGLVWARCSLGQQWNTAVSPATCTGTATTMTHEAALAAAQAAKGWRLPNVMELKSLVDDGCTRPAVDAQAFPNVPQESADPKAYSFSAYWTSTPYASNSEWVWTVDFASVARTSLSKRSTSGLFSSDSNAASGFVRLVRTGS